MDDVVVKIALIPATEFCMLGDATLTWWDAEAGILRTERISADRLYMQAGDVTITPPIVPRR